MTIHTDAIYLNGALQLKTPLLLAEGAAVRVVIETAAGLELNSGSMQAIDPLADVIGIADGPAAGNAARAHDDYLYGTP